MNSLFCATAGCTCRYQVIVPALTWVATAQAAMDIGANVVFVDIDPKTLCIDARAAEAAVTPRTKAVIPLHLYGCICDMDGIMAVAEKHGLKVVEDVAHQHGSQWHSPPSWSTAMILGGLRNSVETRLPR